MIKSASRYIWMFVLDYFFRILLVHLGTHFFLLPFCYATCYPSNIIKVFIEVFISCLKLMLYIKLYFIDIKIHIYKECAFYSLWYALAIFHKIYYDVQYKFRVACGSIN